jgi:2-phospho-L-lactate guanylyltransferase
MQATVAAFDESTGAGSVLLDDGADIGFGREALAGTGLRLLRRGQRVRIETAGEGTSLVVVRLQILTLPWPGHDEGPASDAGPS